MAFYSLLIVEQQKPLSTVARDRAEALAVFGKELGMQLSLEDSDAASTVYFLDEWEVGPRFTNPTIRVFATLIPR